MEARSQINLRVTPETKEEIRKRAGNEGISAYVVRRALEPERELPKPAVTATVGSDDAYGRRVRQLTNQGMTTRVAARIARKELDRSGA